MSGPCPWVGFNKHYSSIPIFFCFPLRLSFNITNSKEHIFPHSLCLKVLCCSFVCLFLSFFFLLDFLYYKGNISFINQFFLWMQWSSNCITTLRMKWFICTQCFYTNRYPKQCHFGSFFSLLASFDFLCSSNCHLKLFQDFKFKIKLPLVYLFSTNICGSKTWNGVHSQTTGLMNLSPSTDWVQTLQAWPLCLGRAVPLF